MVETTFYRRPQFFEACTCTAWEYCCSAVHELQCNGFEIGQAVKYTRPVPPVVHPPINEYRLSRDSNNHKMRAPLPQEWNMELNSCLKIQLLPFLTLFIRLVFY
jgi:hypothetical protein